VNAIKVMPVMMRIS